MSGVEKEDHHVRLEGLEESRGNKGLTKEERFELDRYRLLYRLKIQETRQQAKTGDARVRARSEAWGEGEGECESKPR